MTDPTIQIAEVQGRYEVCAGRIIVARDQAAEQYGAGVIEKTEERKMIDQMFVPWGTVLMVGGRFKPDDYRPDVAPGQRVFFSPTGSRDVELAVGDEKMTVTLVSFESILIIDREAVSA